MAPRECVICASEPDKNDHLVQLPCGRHGACATDCLQDYFERATEDESLFPASCCSVELPADEYLDLGYLGFDQYLEYKKKQAGEYSVGPRFRVYCANIPCNEFVGKDNYERVAGAEIAKCDYCQTITCVSCKSELVSGTCLEGCANTVAQAPQSFPELYLVTCQNGTNRRCGPCYSRITSAVHNHKCQVPEDVHKLRDAAVAQGWKECYGCGKIIELKEACNHITCDCGAEFCYICSTPWDGLHGCPLYGVPVYDEEGYNQDGFHRDTGLDRDGFARDDENGDDEEEDDDEDDEDDEGDGDEDDERDNDNHDHDEQADDNFWDLISPEMRQILDNLPDDVRWEAIQQERIRLAEAGILLLKDQGQHLDDARDNDAGEDDEAEEQQEIITNADRPATVIQDWPDVSDDSDESDNNSSITSTDDVAATEDIIMVDAPSPAQSEHGILANSGDEQDLFPNVLEGLLPRPSLDSNVDDEEL